MPQLLTSLPMSQERAFRDFSDRQLAVMIQEGNLLRTRRWLDAGEERVVFFITEILDRVERDPSKYSQDSQDAVRAIQLGDYAAYLVTQLEDGTLKRERAHDILIREFARESV